jgi:hypothetical protein
VAQGRDLRNTLGSSLSGRNYFNNPINFFITIFLQNYSLDSYVNLITNLNSTNLLQSLQIFIAAEAVESQSYIIPEEAI